MKKDYPVLKKEALDALTFYMDSMDEKKGAKLAYWVRDYVRFLQKESTFDLKKIIRYKRGSIVKAHLGYRVGSEEGGLHYAVVIDVNNELFSPTATVIPLTSIKPHTDLEHLHPSKVLLGDEIYLNLFRELGEYLHQTAQMYQAAAQQQIDILSKVIRATAPDAKVAAEEPRTVPEKLNTDFSMLNARRARCEKMLKEIEKMKQGSIALVGQITTISKIRIYDPLYPSDVLSNIRLSNDALDKLDAKIKALYTKAAADTK